MEKKEIVELVGLLLLGFSGMVNRLMGLSIFVVLGVGLVVSLLYLLYHGQYYADERNFLLELATRWALCLAPIGFALCFVSKQAGGIVLFADLIATLLIVILRYKYGYIDRAIALRIWLLYGAFASPVYVLSH
ncbi:MAG: hypothetical protein IJU72_07785 [Bacteroidales bacterium]|nr:hypothetical protein [Bacteroidales bacterium]